MPLNITVHNPPQLRNGAMPRVPMLDANVSAQVVALGTQSAAITGPCLVRMIADEDQRIAAVTSGAYAAPPATGIKLKAGVECALELPKGTWYLNVAIDATQTASPVATLPIAAIILAAAVASLAAGASTAPVSVPVSASYILRYVFAGTTPSLVVETLGPDGTTWIALTAALTASGQQGVVLGANSSVRLHNTGANPITGLSADLV